MAGCQLLVGWLPACLAGCHLGNHTPQYANCEGERACVRKREPHTDCVREGEGIELDRGKEGRCINSTSTAFGSLLLLIK